MLDVRSSRGHCAGCSDRLQSSNSRTTSRCPCFEAKCNGAKLPLSRTFTSAPRSFSVVSKRTTLSFPSRDAKANGVLYVPSRTSTAMPELTNIRMTSRCPFWDATCSGVEPSLSVIWISAPCLIRKPTTSSFPLLDARYNDVCFVCRRIESGH
jgi:hypothetical protein